jgi:hypothetical protein
MFAWSQLDFSAIPVSISAVSLTNRQTWQNVTSKRRLQRTQYVLYRKGKDIRKKRHLAVFVFVPSVLGRSFQQLNFENDIGRNFLLRNRKKIAKCLKRTFTCRSNFLYCRTKS